MLRISRGLLRTNRFQTTTIRKLRVAGGPIRPVKKAPSVLAFFGIFALGTVAFVQLSKSRGKQILPWKGFLDAN